MAFNFDPMYWFDIVKRVLFNAFIVIPFKLWNSLPDWFQMTVIVIFSVLFVVSVIWLIINRDSWMNVLY